jgi:CheY-like chemotaxis protein
VRILLVDDQAIAKAAAASLLQKLGHEVETADSGFEAMRILTQQTFDIVFLDIEMPGMDGYQTARALRRIRPDEKKPRLYALTAGESQETANNCRRAGMDGWVTKPLRKESFERLGNPPAKGASPTLEMIDASVVADLRLLNDEDGKPLLFELVRRYRADLPNRLARLWSAFEQRDLTEMQKNAHALRSCSLTLGAVGVSRAAEPIERMRAIDGEVFEVSMQSVQRAADHWIAALSVQT